MDESIKLNNQIILNYLGLGIFLWLADNTLTNFIDEILRDLLITSGIHPVMNFWICNIVTTAFFAFFILLFVRYLRRSDLSKKLPFRKCLTITLIILAIGLTIQFIGIFITNFLQFHDNGDNWNNYFDLIYKGTFYSVIDRIFYFMRYALAALIIIRRIGHYSIGAKQSSEDLLDL